MTSPVLWHADGTPRSAHFDDIYRSAGLDGQGGWEQARRVFLHGCGLLSRPDASADASAWAGAAQWRVLELGFGLGLNFLATWLAWANDPARPRLLHYAAIEAWPVQADDLLRSVAAFAPLQPLAAELAAQWHGLLPGVHRLELAQGQVLLTLALGQVQPLLRDFDCAFDAVFLDGFKPACNPEMWSTETLRALARCCRRGTRLATWCCAAEVCQRLQQVGFVVSKQPGLPPKRQRLQAVFEPAWQPRSRNRPALTQPAPLPGRPEVVVVGAGLAGAAVAASLARRGLQVLVLDAAAQPAAGASGLPAGLAVPHVSPDDNLLSRLTRAGVRATLGRAAALLRRGLDWDASGVLEQRRPGKRRLPPDWPAAGWHWSCDASAAQCRAAGLPDAAAALWHASAGWLRPAQLVRAQLATPGVHWRGAARVAALRQDADGGWQLQDADGTLLVRCAQVVLAAGYGCRALLESCSGSAAAEVDGAGRHGDHAASVAAAPLLRTRLPLEPLRGQIAYGALAALPVALLAALPAFPVNGNGSLISGVPLDDRSAASPPAPGWLVGSTFERCGGRSDDLAQWCQSSHTDHQANQQRLQGLLPGVDAAMLEALFVQPDTHAWAQVRATLPDRLPAVGLVDPQRRPGLWLCAGLGARGISLSVLCGELLAAQWLGEPWPLAGRLALALAAQRFR